MELATSLFGILPLIAVVEICAPQPGQDAAVQEESVGEPVARYRTLEIDLKLSEAETSVRCEHGDEQDSAGNLFLVGDSYKIKLALGVTDRPIVPGSSSFSRNYDQLSLEFTRNSRYVPG